MSLPAVIGTTSARSWQSDWHRKKAVCKSEEGIGQIKISIEHSACKWVSTRANQHGSTTHEDATRQFPMLRLLSEQKLKVRSCKQAQWIKRKEYSLGKALYSEGEERDCQKVLRPVNRPAWTASMKYNIMRSLRWLMPRNYGINPPCMLKWHTERTSTWQKCQFKGNKARQQQKGLKEKEGRKTEKSEKGKEISLRRWSNQPRKQQAHTLSAFQCTLAHIHNTMCMCSV